MRISDWSSDVCSSDLLFEVRIARADAVAVVDLDHAAERTGPAGMGDFARRCGIDSRLHCGAEVETAMGRLAAVERVSPGSEAAAELELIQRHAQRQGAHDALQCGPAAEPQVQQRQGNLELGVAVEVAGVVAGDKGAALERSEAHTSELPSLMRNSYAFF